MPKAKYNSTQSTLFKYIMKKFLYLIALAIIAASCKKEKEIIRSDENVEIRGTWRINQIITHKGDQITYNFSPNYNAYLQFNDSSYHFIRFSPKGDLEVTKFNQAYSYSNNKFIEHSTNDFVFPTDLVYANFFVKNDTGIKMNIYLPDHERTEYHYTKVDIDLEVYGR